METSMAFMPSRLSFQSLYSESRVYAASTGTFHCFRKSSFKAPLAVRENLVVLTNTSITGTPSRIKNRVKTSASVGIPISL